MLRPSPPFHIEWFYRLSTSPGSIESVLQRERTRRNRLLSTIVLVLIGFILLIIPATIFIPNVNTLRICLVVLTICCLALVLNRAGKMLLAGGVIVIACEIGFMLVIGTTIPFDTFNLPLYDLMAIAEILAVSLLSARSVFFVASLNCTFICCSLLFQLHSASFSHVLGTQLYNAMIRPISLQLVVAAVAYLWVSSTNRAIEQSDRAQALANLEHDLAEKAQEAVKQKKALEIALIMLGNNMTDALVGRPPEYALEDLEPLLWPLQGKLEQLQVQIEKATRKAEQSEHIISSIGRARDDPQALKELLDEFYE